MRAAPLFLEQGSFFVLMSVFTTFHQGNQGKLYPQAYQAWVRELPWGLGFIRPALNGGCDSFRRMFYLRVARAPVGKYPGSSVLIERKNPRGHGA